MTIHRSIAAAVAVAAATLTGPALAHESRPVGSITTVVGWLNEPAFAGVVNAVSIRATRGGQPVTSASLKAVVTFAGGGEALTLNLSPAFRDPGHYRAFLVPTRPGSYTFKISGKLGGADFDQSYTSGDDTFDEIQPTAAVEFPEKDPSRDQLADRAEQQEKRIAILKTAVSDAKDAAGLARLLSIVALALGAAGLLFGFRKART